MLTVEDILEEIVGEIRDEFDDDEIPAIRKVEEGHYLLDATLLLEEVEKLLYVEFEAEGIDTLGGWYFTQDIDLELNKKIHYQGYDFAIAEKDGRHIQYVEVIQSTAQVAQHSEQEQQTEVEE